MARIVVCAVIASLLLSGCDRAVGPEDQIVVRGRAPTAARLSERVDFAVIARNPGERSVRVSGLSCAAVGVEVRSRSTLVWQSYLGPQLSCATILHLAPGDSSSFSIAWDGRDNLDRFVEPGTYDVRIGLVRGDRLVAADPQRYPLVIRP